MATAQNLPVCIVGAGVAGLKAGSDLQKSGVSYVILEGASRIGGRVYPVAYEDGYLQYGATYINGNKNPIYSIAKQNGLVDMKATNSGSDYVPLNTLNATITGRDLRDFTDFAESLEEKYAKMAENGNAQETVTKAFEKEYQSFLLKGVNRTARREIFDPLAKMYITELENEWAARMDNFAVENYNEFDDGSEEGTEYTLNKMGFKTILDIIAANIPKEKIKLNSTVTKIDYSNGSTVDVTSSSGKMKCSTVIVTCSLGYLKRHAATLFTPSLPREKSRAIETLGFGLMQKIFLVYEKAWLKDVAYRTMGASNSTVFGRGLAFDVTPWSNKTIQFWFSGPAVTAIGNMTDPQVMESITAHLKQTLKNETVPVPQRVIRHMWHTDPLILGSYSSHTPASVALGDANDILAEPILADDESPLVLFAGEATHSTVYQTVIGAFLSGQREARRIIDQ